MLKQIPFYSSLIGQPVGNGVANNSHILVYGSIEVHSFGEKGCIASNKTIGEEVGLTANRVAHIISELNKSGWVQVILDEKNNRKKIIPLLKIVRGVLPVTKGYVTGDKGGMLPATTEDNTLGINANALISKFNLLLKRNFRVTDKVKRLLKTRLKVYTMDEVMLALEKMAADPFNQGQNDRGWSADPEYLLRNDSQIDKFLNKKSLPKKQEFVKFDDTVAQQIAEKKI